jgi:hypothetical protein
MPPEMFILDRGMSPLPAKRVCAECPVRPPCERYGELTDSIGVWGGKYRQFRVKR